MWAMVHSGTANVGIRLSGSPPMSALGALLANNPSVVVLVSTPAPMAPAKSRSPAMQVQIDAEHEILESAFRVTGTLGVEIPERFSEA
jgi:hypothetical protein